MTQVERDSVHAIVTSKDHNRGDVVDVSKGISLLWSIHSREQDSPEEQGYDNLKSQTRLIEEDAPLPQAPRGKEVFAVGCHYWFFVLLTHILSYSEDKEKGIGYCCQEDTPICEEHESRLFVIDQMV